MLGLYVSDHPLLGAEAALRRRTDGTIEEAKEAEDGSVRVVGGVVTGVQRKWTKKGDLMAVFFLEDLEGLIEVMVFPEDDVRCRPPTGGRCRTGGQGSRGQARGPTEDRGPRGRLIRSRQRTDSAVAHQGARVCARRPPDHRSASPAPARPGESPVFLHVGDSKVLRLPEEYCAEVTGGLIAEIRVLFGADSIL